jgi:hypothetical protein
LAEWGQGNPDLIFAHADTAIADENGCTTMAAPTCFDGNEAARGREFYGVAQQVGNHLTQPNGIAAHRW